MADVSALGAGSDLLDRVRHVLHDNHLGCTTAPGKHDPVARQLVAAILGADGTLVDAITTVLADVRIRLGPKTVANIAAGQVEIPLSGSERRDIAQLVLGALGIEVTG